MTDDDAVTKHPWTGDTNTELPMDSDVEAATVASPRPAHLRIGYLGLVALGGMAGTAVREAISLGIAPIGGFPIAIFGINVLGAFVLGALLELLALRGPDEGRRRRIRLLVGTGVLGGFTTYSSFATDTAQLLADGSAGIAILYAFLTLLAGALATWAGIVVAMRLGRRRPRRRREARS
ncbi:CrcB family protein [Herbiconiux sp. CPCC 205763]|uniref:Fluoride-specific ion channel FluC n=1 Tax=Herbiconiux aconitum TaxID=2970913 RepID=A0ABT2GMI6_9MICO|nr:CrcB family protein [Herbiconiux aconitum]MCS5717336.1 CrcB family protein [Herbiconiux aconitum]